VDRAAERSFRSAFAHCQRHCFGRTGAARRRKCGNGGVSVRYRRSESCGGHVIAYQMSCSVQYMCQILMI